MHDFDGYIQDVGPLGAYYSLTIEDSYIGQYGSLDELDTAIKEYIKGNNFSPSLAYINDHGNIEPYTY